MPWPTCLKWRKLLQRNKTKKNIVCETKERRNRACRKISIGDNLMMSQWFFIRSFVPFANDLHRVILRSILVAGIFASSLLLQIPPSPPLPSLKKEGGFTLSFHLPSTLLSLFLSFSLFHADFLLLPPPNLIADTTTESLILSRFRVIRICV